MNEDLKKVIETSKLILHEEYYVVAQVKTVPEGKHFLITQDPDEISVVTKKENLHELDVIEKSDDERSLFEIQFSPDAPDTTGFLAVVSEALAKEEISIAIVSTYSKDYILVPKENTEKAFQALKALGFQ